MTCVMYVIKVSLLCDRVSILIDKCLNCQVNISIVCSYSNLIPYVIYFSYSPFTLSASTWPTASSPASSKPSFPTPPSALPMSHSYLARASCPLSMKSGHVASNHSASQRHSTRAVHSRMWIRRCLMKSTWPLLRLQRSLRRCRVMCG